ELEASRQYAASADAWARVPAALVTSRPDFERSRLRALAFGAPGTATPGLLDEYATAHPADAEIRSLAVEAWQRAGQPARALKLVEALAARPDATAADRLLYITLLVSGRDARSAGAITSYVTKFGCDDRVLTQVDRLADPAATDTLVRLVNSRSCAAGPRWVERAIERSVALGHHTAARELFAKLPPAKAEPLPMKRLAGQLALWTGHPAEAVTRLEEVIRLAPHDVDAQVSLIDAYRAVGRPRDAWALAEPLVPQSQDANRCLMWADLALNADRPEAVPAILNRVPASATLTGLRTALLGRSLQAMGQPADALRLLSSLDPKDLDAAAALALIDSQIAVSGLASALASSRAFAADAPAWRDVAARQYVIESAAGDAARAAASREKLNRWDPQAVSIADAEVELARQQPQKALTALARLDANRRTADVLDLESIALAGVGRYPEALKSTIELRALRPESFAYALREADLRHRIAPSAGTRARIASLAESHPENRDAAALLARVRLTDASEFDAAARRQFALGNQPAARDAAERAVAIDSSKTDAWLVLAQLAAADGPEALSVVLMRVSPVVQITPEFAPAVADTLSGYVRRPDDPLAAGIVAWIDSLPQLPAGAAASLQLSRARVLVGASQWDPALKSIDAVLTSDGGNVAALRLKADVLSWSGRHAEGIAAYDTYLARRPDDLDAARQQARVMGWAGRFADARRRYARLAADHPEVAIITAEAAAKTAFYDGRWNDAVEAYARVLAIEPKNGEAAFERAQALRAGGHVAAADAALAALASSGDHQLAGPAWDRVQEARRPAVTATADSRSSDGYQDRRLLELHAAGAAFQATAGRNAASFNVNASSVRLAGGDAASSGYRVGAATTWSPAASVSVRGQLTGWALDNTSNVRPEYVAGLDWRPIDRWTIGAGADRSLLLENMDVVERGLSATGGFATARFDSPTSSLDAGLGWHHLSDDNSRMRASVSYGRRLTDRVKDLRLMIWSELLSFQRSSDAYYSPSRQIRIDAGLQYTQNFRTPGFAQDLSKRLTMGYLVGTDRDGVVYQHPTLKLTCEFTNGLALVAQGDWIRSSVYNERSISVHFTVTPSRLAR
ncbi:MAG TPA: tetratricopeptide repeat protein, partial [Vicinamibacterales bacterium]|nr:tetratricopeptide repeat protein [Vicinamibacterales bacterium]